MSPEPDPFEDLPSDLTSGYQGLASMERRFASHALQTHRHQIEAWHRLLTLLTGAFTGRYHIAISSRAEQADLLRVYLIAGLGAGTSKLSLDAALAGYYSQSFMLTRHMLESWAQAAYVRVRPDEAYRWYDQPSDPSLWTGPPSFKKARRAVGLHTQPKELTDRVDGVIKLLNKGAHPSAEMLAQTVGVRSGQIVVGANYDPELAAGAFYYGVYATFLLLAEFMEIVEEKEAWADQLRASSRLLRSWLESWLDEEPAED